MRYFALAILMSFSCFSCSQKTDKIQLQSQDGSIVLNFYLNETGSPRYALTMDDLTVLAPSQMGLLSEEADFSNGFKITEHHISDYNETWQPVWGQFADIQNQYRQLVVKLQNSRDDIMEIHFRLYNDGLGFRYYFPEQESVKHLSVKDELTQFAMAGDHKTWWVPGCWDNDEYPYTESKISEVNTSYFQHEYPYSNATSITHLHSVNTPVTMKTENGQYYSIHEAALIDFPGMSLTIDTATFTYKSHLAESHIDAGVKARVNLPFQTPWRSIQLARNAGELITSSLILNLNEPNRLEDVSWIEPMKYMGIWWEMHVGKSSWDLASGKHGATTENAKKYIDFCAENGIRGLLIEGWNTGWESWTGENREGIFDFQTPYPDFDLEAVVKYAKNNGVTIETAAAIETYEKHMEAAYKLYRDLGIKAVKTGYVGKIPDHRHYDQRMVNHYNETVTKTAEYGIMVNIHEPIKPTGLSRTYPNLMTGEGMRGQEFNAWSDGNHPSHNVTLPFTRMLAGPMDFTPGIFDLKLEKYKNSFTQVSSFDTRGIEEEVISRVYSTLAHQLGLYVVFYSPLQMAADLPENYAGHPAFQFIKDVGVDWDQTVILDAEIASHVIVSRKEKQTDNWFIGGITGENPYTANIALDFLPEGRKYTGHIYRDHNQTNYLENPGKYIIESVNVDNTTILNIPLKAAGGFAVSLVPVK
ncbi:MAG: glycoside hydrolase family 97 protein [Cyclobacteriaceae bacterium]|nr:glycoside hydrolase family 97 protein [Cyclobacteriaceae bacterium]